MYSNRRLILLVLRSSEPTASEDIIAVCMICNCNFDFCVIVSEVVNIETITAANKDIKSDVVLLTYYWIEVAVNVRRIQ